jgi:hypothetical protein
VRLLVFLHGTTLMHAGGAGVTREMRVEQVRSDEPSVRRFDEYIPIGDAARKVKAWSEQGADIFYLSSRTTAAEVAEDEEVLRAHGFPKCRVLFRREGETYTDVVKGTLPDVIIEDDCESIGGASQQTYAQLPQHLRRRIKSIVVREFGGIDDLPESLDELLR